MDVDEEKSDNDETMDGETSRDHSTKSGNAGGKLEYSHIRDANIAENKRLLSELGLLSVLGNTKDKATKRKEEREGGNYKVKLGVSEVGCQNLTNLVTLARLPLARTLINQPQVLILSIIPRLPNRWTQL